MVALSIPFGWGISVYALQGQAYHGGLGVGSALCIIDSAGQQMGT